MSEKKKKKANKSTSSSVVGDKVQLQDSSDNRASDYLEVRRLLQIFYTSRKRSIDLMENMINLLNKQTYYDKNKIRSITSPLLSTSSFSGLVEEELILHISSLQSERANTLETLKKLQEVWFQYKSTQSEETDDTSRPLAIEAIEELLSQITQQTLLDELIADQLLLSPHKQKSQDELITMATCIKTSPYLNEMELKTIIEMK
eukprot:gene3523-3764_t